MKRYDIINHFINKKGYTRFLEIGHATGEAFSQIECDVMHSVDPEGHPSHKMTSDEFFEQNTEKYDIIFIDGLHHADQVEKDIRNSIEALNEGGTIVMHDCSPTDEKMQIVPRQQGVWTGDVWKAYVKFLANNNDKYECFVIDSDWGCGVIREGSSKSIELPDELTYEWLERNRKQALNLISVQEFLEIC